MNDPTWHVALAALLAALCADFEEAQAVKSRIGSLGIPGSWEEAWGQVATARDELRRERAHDVSRT
jgi:hypothetical protein